MGLNVLHYHPAGWSPRIFPSLPGSRLTNFYRDASPALLHLVNQWFNFTYSRTHVFCYGRQNKNPSLTRIKLTTSAQLAGVQVIYHSGDEGTGLGGNNSKVSKEIKKRNRKKKFGPTRKEIVQHTIRTRRTRPSWCIILGGNGATHRKKHSLLRNRGGKL